MSLKKIALLTIAILMVMGLSTVAAQEPPQLFQNQPAECSDPAFLTLGGDPPAALLELIPTQYGIYTLYLVYNKQNSVVALLSGPVDLFFAVVYHLEWSPETDIQWEAPLDIQEAPSLISPKTLLAWNMLQVWVVNCGSDGFKYQFTLVTENPSPEVTPEAEAELSLPLGQ